MNWSKATWEVFFFFFLLLLVNPILTTHRFFYENLNMWGALLCLPAAPCSQACPGGCRLEVRGVAAEARLHCEPVPGRRAALPDQTLIGFDTASRRREEAFLLLFFFSSISKREPFLYERPLLCSPLSSNSPWFCCAPCPPPRSSLSLLSLRSHIDSLISFLRLKPADFCFLCPSLLSSLSLGCWPVNLILSITTSKNYFCPLSL